LARSYTLSPRTCVNDGRRHRGRHRVGISSSGRADLVDELDRLGTNLLTVERGNSVFGEQQPLPDVAAAMIRRVGPVTQNAAVTGTATSIRRTPHTQQRPPGSAAVLHSAKLRARLGLSLETVVSTYVGALQDDEMIDGPAHDAPGGRVEHHAAVELAFSVVSDHSFDSQALEFERTGADEKESADEGDGDLESLGRAAVRTSRTSSGR
jgi:hypothetical protein